ncbi:MAG TPA: SigE family RNA polymerase sigma factor [Nocardioides sp.]|nr:SigE family RNA polymerase sigma factor [Nocardioides sp.]
MDDFDEFFRATWPRLFRTAYAVAGDAASAEDALQAAFARVFASWRRISSVDHPEAYVRRMVVNEIIGDRRRGWWRRERPTAEPDQAGAAGRVQSPEVGVADRQAVWAAVRALPVRQRAVIVLRYYEDLSEREIAEVLGCSPGTVKSQASAALANLRRNAAVLPNGDLA